ncbi:DNA-binding protein [Mycobacterium sp. E2462]|uniref:APC family permease n=1 Tax=Mycobacterium sp. E2462 TaxID=1834133 RepID=UPI0007FC3772|nr:APC family permease [Mycobacterium sp. E2462]OBI09121.1 DNA-binding protein [Mycobacterium sp. E2462]
MTTSAGVLPPSIPDRCKRLFLGQPLTTDQLEAERLPNKIALGALSPDAISSTAYGTEQIMIELLPAAGMSAFTLLLPITGVILVILALVTVSYRQVVMRYARSGGSYTVARDNFGPRVAQIAAAALLIDYVVTVAVQPAAATVAVVSAIPALRPYHLEITLASVVLICLMNLRGLRRSGRMFAITTYAFVAMILVTIVTGFVREMISGLPKYDPQHIVGAVPIHQGNGLLMGATVLIVLRAFANGGTSLTGVEAISNTVSLFRKPEGVNARKVLTVMACILGFLLAGVAWLAHVTHATPYLDEYPSMLSEITRAVYGHGVLGNALYFMVQAATAAILFTGCNTSFNGFPSLANFVAEDRFLPRPLTKRGHRLVFSNGILLLTALALVLLLVTEAKVSALVPFFAIGVFTAFSMAGYGMAKHHLTNRGKRWRLNMIANLATGLMSTVVVGIFVVAKFTEGAWLIVIIFPLLVLILMRLNHKYRAEASVLETTLEEHFDVSRHPRLRVLVFVDHVDLAEIEALRYGNGLHAEDLAAVHFVIDQDHADRLEQRWEHFEHHTPLRMIDCPDRHLSRAAHELVCQVLQEHPDSRLTVLLPRRTYSPLLGRLLHDRTADRMARAVSRIPGATAIIVPYDIESRIARIAPVDISLRHHAEPTGGKVRIPSPVGD